MADRVLAKSLFDKGMKIRARLMPVHDPRGLKAFPKFHDYSQDTIEHLLDATSLSHVELLQKMCTPICWECQGHKGSTAAQAIEIAFSAREKMAPVRAANRERSQELSLPRLTGTAKQVEWAENIRIGYTQKQPLSQHLKKQTVAGWWIDNRHAL